MKECQKCGAKNSDSAKFCKKCGNEFIESLEELPIEGEIVDSTHTKKESKIKGALEGIGSILFMLVSLIVFVFIIFAFIKGATFLSEKVLPILSNVVIPLLILELVIVLPMALSKKLKYAAGMIVYVGSYVYGLTAWLIGFITTLYLWGAIWVIVGLFIAGVGVVPFGIIAAGIDGQWGIVFNLIVLIILTYGSRILGAYLAEE